MLLLIEDKTYSQKLFDAVAAIMASRFEANAWLHNARRADINGGVHIIDNILVTNCIQATIAGRHRFRYCIWNSESYHLCRLVPKHVLSASTAITKPNIFAKLTSTAQTNGFKCIILMVCSMRSNDDFAHCSPPLKGCFLLARDVATLEQGRTQTFCVDHTYHAILFWKTWDDKTTLASHNDVLRRCCTGLLAFPVMSVLSW